MRRLHDPLPPADKKPGEVPPQIPETEARKRQLPEGQLPGMPVWRDPLREPGPNPAETETPPPD
jgi:hypothetical protein